MSELYHYGIKGQKWGVRRYQNEDGTLTPEGKKRYLNPDGSYNDLAVKELKIKGKNPDKVAEAEIKGSLTEKRKSGKKALKIGAAITAGLAAVSVAAIVSGQLSYKKGRKIGQNEAWNDAADYSREISALRRQGHFWGNYDKDLRGLKLRDAGIDVFEPDLFGRVNKRTGKLE